VRITDEQREGIKTAVEDIAGDDASVILFGSRVDDDKRGGDVDLLVDLPRPVDNPAWLAARLSARVSKLMDGRSVDVLISARNLKEYPIHEQARRSGVRL